MDILTDRLQQGSRNFVYASDQLLALRSKHHAGKVYPIPEELARRYRGSRAGALVKARRLQKRWRFEPAIPSFVMGNVNSLANKSDELAALVVSVKLLAVPHGDLAIQQHPGQQPGFTTVRADRDLKLSGKRKGGGLALYVSVRWCNPGHVTVKETICCPDIEVLAVSLRPYYMPTQGIIACHCCLCLHTSTSYGRNRVWHHLLRYRWAPNSTFQFRGTLIMLLWTQLCLLFTSLCLAQQGRTGQLT